MQERSSTRRLRRKSVAALVCAAMTAPWAGVAAATEGAGDPSVGERAFRQCVACHSVQPGENRVGPYLFGVVGREAGSVEQFRYSRAMQQADIVWDEENLATYIADPRGFLPGTSMALRIRNPDDLPHIIAYLKTLTQE
ncbi:MAG: cytochrome c family protein [Kiloniellales bacterium]|nr:cytochrome c family protein [Kiloniellales bacterium]